MVFLVVLPMPQALAGTAPAPPGRVLIVSMAGVTWEDVAAGRAPELRALGERWSMGALAVRTVDSPTDRTSAFVTIGAGNRARGRGLAPAQWDRIAAANARLHFGAVPGALGEALHRHGVRTGVIGDAGGPAALALADRSGHVDVSEAPAPGDEAAATGRALASAVVVVVELRGAIERDDSVLARLLGRVDPAKDTVLVLGTPAGTPERLMVAVGAGAGMERGGWLTSATTHRNGLVTLPDVAPGVLRLFGIAPPDSMTGQALHPVPAPPGRLPTLLGLQSAAAAYSRRVAPFTVAVAVLGVAVFLLGWWELRPGNRGAHLPLRAAALGVAAAPLACLVQAAAGAERWSTGPAVAFLAAADAAIAGPALAGPWRRRPGGPPLFVAALTVAVLALDLLTGARGQLSSLIGYSPIEAGRFYGLSAVSFAVLTTYVLVLAGVFAGAVPRHSPAVVVGLGAVTVAVAGAPMLGAKFGSILTLVPAFGLLAVLVSGRRLSLGRTALLGAAAAAVALGAGMADALRPAQSQTHIGRFASRLLGGGPSSVSDVLLRKADANLGIFVRAPIAAAVPVALAFVAVVILRPPAWLAPRLERVPGLRAGVLAAVAANALALFVNDSGVAIPGMGLAIGVPFAIALLLGSAGAGANHGAGEVRRIPRATRAKSS